MDFDWNLPELVPEDIMEALNQIPFLEKRDEGSGVEPSFEFPAVPGMLPCPNCQGDDWQLDDLNCFLVCGGCGLADDTWAPNGLSGEDIKTAGRYVPIESLPSTRALAELPPTTSRRQRRSTIPYQREAYWRKLLKRWGLEDDPIGEEDWARIVGSFVELFGGRVPTADEVRRANGRRIADTVELTKEDVRRICLHCDARVRAELAEIQPDFTGMAKFLIEEQAKPHFNQKYVPRWFHIRWRLCGLKSAASKASPDLPEAIHRDLRTVRRAFEMLQVHMGRKAFPFNTFFRYLLVLNRHSNLAEDFPAMKTSKGIRQAEACLWLVCKYLKWPYLSDKAAILAPYRKKLNI